MQACTQEGAKERSRATNYDFNWVAHSGVSGVFGERVAHWNPDFSVAVLRNLDVILDMHGNQATHIQPEGISNAKNISREQPKKGNQP